MRKLLAPLHRADPPQPRPTAPTILFGPHLCHLTSLLLQASDGASIKRPADSAEEAPAKRAKEAAKPAAPTTGLGGLAAYSDSDSVSERAGPVGVCCERPLPFAAALAGVGCVVDFPR